MLPSQDLLNDPNDILAHIFFAVGTIDEVVVSASGSDFVGSMCYPDDLDGILIVSPNMNLIRKGSETLIEYIGPEDHYRFQSRVLSLENNGIRISLPTQIERNDRRLTGRHPCPESSGFTFVAIDLPGAPSFDICDISVGGIGLYDFPDNESSPMKVGDLIVGEIRLQTEATITACLEVRNLRLRRGKCIVGTRISAITILDRGRLARFIVNHSSGVRQKVEVGSIT